MSWSNFTVIVFDGSATMVSSGGFVATIIGAVTGAITSIWCECAISTRPSFVMASCSASGPFDATFTRWSVARSTITSGAPFVCPSGAWFEMNSSPSSAVPSRPNAIESAGVSRRTCTCGWPRWSNFTMSPRAGQLVAQSSPVGENARSSTRYLLNSVNAPVTRSKISMPLPVET